MSENELLENELNDLTRLIWGDEVKEDVFLRWDQGEFPPICLTKTIYQDEHRKREKLLTCPALLFLSELTGGS